VPDVPLLVYLTGILKEERAMRAIHQPFPINEDKLIQQAIQGSLEAFNQLVLTYQDLAYHQACAVLGDEASAEDATQQSFIKAFQGMKSFRGGSFRAWLLKIVTHSAYDMQRQSKRHPTLPLYPEDDDGDEIESPAWLADPAPSVQNIVEQNEFLKTLYRRVDELPEAYRSVITLVDIHEFDYMGAAKALDIPVGTVKSRLARARLQVASSMREEGP
jgi:RNA polymerase sigma-70 factor, ECF subfamily